jgi:hypothetical protein
MEFMDEVQNLEQRAFNEGREQGREDTRNGDMRDAGVISGIIKGFPLGLELGFMAAMDGNSDDLVAKLASSQEEVTEVEEIEEEYGGIMDETIESMNSIEFNGRPKDAIKSISSRVEKRRQLLARRLADVPDHNNAEDFDFTAELDSLRALYRSCNPVMGKFIRDGSVVKEKESSETQKW